jgi:DNA-binding GntR family transcriptional regulator
MPLDAARPVFRTKQELVYRSLRDAILTCEIPPDERLVIEDVARRLNVSAIPVREALQLLQSEGLVTLIPHVGATVTPLSRDSVVDVFSVLEGLQVVAGRLAAERADKPTLAAFEGYVRAMDTAVAATEYDAWADLNTRFHGALSEVSGLKLLQQSTVQALDRWDQIRRYFYKGVLVPRVAQAQREHHELLEGLLAHDPERVATAMRRHYHGALMAYLQYFDGRAGTTGEQG